MVCCGAGAYFLDGLSTACAACAMGTYNTNGNGTVCTVCASGLNSFPGSGTCSASYPVSAVVTERIGLSLKKVNLDGTSVTMMSSLTAYTNVKGVAISNNFDFVLVTMSSAVFILYAPGYIPTVLAGKIGVAGNVDGVGTSAAFYDPADVKISPDNTYALVAEMNGCRVRKVYLNGTTVPFAGSPTNQFGYQEGTGTSILFSGVSSISISPGGDFAVVVDNAYPRIRKLTLSGDVPTSSFLAGSGYSSSSTDGVGSAAAFSNPQCVAISPDSTYALITEVGGFVRKLVFATQTVTSIAPSAFYEGIDFAGLADFAIFVDYNANTLNRMAYPSGAVSQVSATIFNSLWGVTLWKCKLAGYGYNTSLYCSQCPINTYGPGNGTCLPCGSGLASSPGSSVCITGASPGTYFSVGGTSNAVACPSGSFCVGGLSAPQTCSICSAGSFIVSNCTSSADTVCGACQAGVNYSTAANSTACSLCTNPFPATSYYYSSSTANNCSFYCDYTSYQSGTTCAPCPLGTYGVPGATVCASCGAPANTYYTGESNCSYLVNCSSGMYNLGRGVAWSDASGASMRYISLTNWSNVKTLNPNPVNGFNNGPISQAILGNSIIASKADGSCFFV